MGLKKARKYVLPVFRLTELCGEADPYATQVIIPPAPSRSMTTYFVRSVQEVEEGLEDSARWRKYNYNLLPVVVDQHGVPWDAATVYILSRLGDQVTPNMSTFDGVAEDLSAFLEFLQEEEIDYTIFPQNKLHRPTYIFHGYLKSQVFDGRLGASTAKRRMGAVISFYRWLENEKAFSPAFPMWVDRDHYLTFKNAHGFETGKKIKSTDVSIAIPKQYDPFDGAIDDGGKLRPLPPEEQRWVFEALAHLGNTEMTLIHSFMLATGARIQTAGTLRVRHVRLELSEGEQEFRFPVGPGTGVDTKYDKLMILFIPRWLYERLRIYSSSDRAGERRARAVGGDSEDQYLFLTQQGSPYYRSKKETLAFDPNNKVRHQKRGQTVRMFVGHHVIPYIRRKHDKRFHYQVHDLRASFGMNLTDQQLALVERKQITLAQARDFVRIRMGHESSATTDIYLNHRSRLKQVYAAVDSHEQYLRGLIEATWEGKLIEQS